MERLWNVTTTQRKERPLKIAAQAGKSGNQHIAVITFDVEEPKTPTTNHTVLLLDCSGSMAGSLGKVRADTNNFVNEISDKDFVSIVIFSGEGQARLIAGPTQCNAAGRSLVTKAIDRDVRVLGSTVFAEPLKVTLETVKRLAGDNMLHHVVLSTDGCAVPRDGNVAREEVNAMNVAKQLDDFGAVVSVIGYGVYYDELFMRRLLEAAGSSGVYRHISEVDIFGPTIHSADEIFRDIRPVNVDMGIYPAKGSAGKVFKTTPELTQVGHLGTILTRGAYQGQMTFFVELSGPCEAFTLRGKVNGKIVEHTVTATALTPESAKRFTILTAAYHYIRGEYKQAEAILRSAGDAALAEKAGSSYTQREQRETSDLFRRYFRDSKFIGAGLKASGPNHCVLNVLRTVIEDTANVVYIPAGAYKRSGELTSDPRVVESPLGRTIKVVGYVSNQSRLNFSVRCLKDVKIVSEDGQSTSDVKIWRSYNVILDGNLHISTLEAVLTADSFVKLQDAGVIKAGTKHVLGKAVTLDLSSIKMISSAWANPATLGLVDLLREEAEREAEQKALNARRKATAPATSGSDTDEDGIYREQAKKVENVPTETYSANCVEIRLMKYKTGSYDAAAAKMDYAQADARVKEVRQRLVVVRYVIRAITFAMEATKSTVIGWDVGKTTKKGEYEKLEQSAMYCGANLKRVTWTEQVVCS